MTGASRAAHAIGSVFSRPLGPEHCVTQQYDGGGWWPVGGRPCRCRGRTAFEKEDKDNWRVDPGIGSGARCDAGFLSLVYLPQKVIFQTVPMGPKHGV